ncbi:hypothetical protein BV898_02037 [Hypsibius exemplaris]|uniref:ZP domain-containing protein n=1 Tax=Hypsibius exemplaris TaxID=2072580 RepID=A0A1W0X9U3_HYPEX|nr:hypothetical protein BV898_02037 [Hypsibius exemplaris]
MLAPSIRLLAILLQASVLLINAADNQNRIKSLNVKCGDADMLVDIEFNQPFNGIIFSKGYFARSECVYVKASPSKYSYEFTIAYGGCGTTAGGNGLSASGARRSDGFLRSADGGDSDLSGNGTRSRRDVTNSSAGALGRSLGGWGGGGNGPEPMGDPYAPGMQAGGGGMQNQDYSGGGMPGGMGGMPGGMGGMPGGMGGMGGNDYSGGPPAGMPNMGGQYGGGQPSQYGGGIPNQQYGGVGGPQQQYGGAAAPQYGGGYDGQQQQGGAWNGGQQGQQGQQGTASGQIFTSNQDQNRAQGSVNVQSSANANSQSGSSSNFASSFPGGLDSSSNGQQQQSQQSISTNAQGSSSQSDGMVSVSSLASKTNQPFGEDQTGGSSRFFENIIIIQYDANIQEVWDVAKALRCEWHDNYHKTVSYKPFQVDSLEVVPATFAGDNVGVWMTVQQGKGPYAPEVNGIVRIGEYLTLAIGIQDQTQKFDMRVINCFASDGSRPQIQLVDEYGCVIRPKIMSDLAKVTNYGDQASVVTYAYFQAFKFPDSVDVHLECSVEICKQGCAKQCYNKMLGDASSSVSGGASRGKSPKGSAIASISTGMHMGAGGGGSRSAQELRRVDSAAGATGAAQSEENSSGGQSDAASASTSDKQSFSASKSGTQSGSGSTSGKGSSSSSLSGKKSSSSASASGQDVVVLSGARSAASSGAASSNQESNMDSVSSKIRDSLNGKKIIVKVATSSPTASAALYNAMGSDDDEEVTTTATTTTTTTTKKPASKKSLRTKKVPADDDDDSAYKRRRRDTESDLQKNVGMKRTIRVVAPGDLSFLETNRNNTVVYAGAQRIVGQGDVCIAPSSFVAGIVVLVALLVLTTLAAMILCLRLRSLDRVSNKMKAMDVEYMKHTL